VEGNVVATLRMSLAGGPKLCMEDYPARLQSAPTGQRRGIRAHPNKLNQCLQLPEIRLQKCGVTIGREQWFA
jgi:hypothetical protein